MGKHLYSILIKWLTVTTDGPITYHLSDAGGQYLNLTGLKIRHKSLEYHFKRNENLLRHFQ